MDEFSRQKGQGNLVTVVSDIDKSSLLEVIDSHKSEEIIQVLKQQPASLREKIREVCVDVWPGFKKVITEGFPNAILVIDRFHVMQLVNKSLNQLRLKQGLKGLKKRWGTPELFQTLGENRPLLWLVKTCHSKLAR